MVFPDLIVSMAMVIAILILTIYLTNQLLVLSTIDYKASMGTYLFTECLLGNFTEDLGLNHVIVMNGIKSGGYLIICPRITANDSRLEAEVYAVYTR